MDKTGSIKNEEEFSFEDTKAHYLRTDDMIKISYSGWVYSYSVSIYKDGTFDYERYASYGVKEVKEGLKNTLIGKYNYNSIKSFIENGNHSNRKILDYLYRVVMDLSKVVHAND
jgi:hypothetical protein